MRCRINVDDGNINPYAATMTEGRESYHHGNLKTALIEAGKQLLISKGITGLSLRETAKAAGVSHTAPYRHFRDKDALLAAIAESGFTDLAAALDETIQAYPGDPEKQLVEAAVVYIKLAITHLEMHQLMYVSSIDEDSMSDSYIETRQQTFNALTRIIKNGQKKAVFNKSPTHELAISAWSLIHGYTMLVTAGHLSGSLKQIEELARSSATSLVQGIAVRPTE